MPDVTQHEYAKARPDTEQKAKNRVSHREAGPESRVSAGSDPTRKILLTIRFNFSH